MKQKFGTRLTSLLLCLALVAGLLQGLPVTAKAADIHGSDIDIGTTWFVGDKIDLGDSLYDQWFLARPDVKAYRNKFGKGEAVVPEPDKWQYPYDIGHGDWVWRFHECLHAFAQTETGIITIPYSMYFKVDEENPDRKPIGFMLMKDDDDVYYFEPMYTHTHDNKTFLPWNESSILPSNAGNYYLTDDVALSSTWNVPPGETSLCLNNHTIYINGIKDVIRINAGSTLNLYHNGERSKIRHYDFEGRGVYIDGGVLTMYGGAITNNAVNGDGGGVYVGNGGYLFMINGSAVKENRALSGRGGGVYVSESSFLSIDGAIIQGNQAAGPNGGGVYVSDNAHFAMLGGEITSNSLESGKGGGVYADGSTIYYWGGKVEGNKTLDSDPQEGDASNFYLPEGKKIVLRYGGTDQSVGVSMEKPGVFTQKEGNMDGVKEWFTSDDDRYYVDYEGVELALRCKVHDFVYILEKADTIKAECTACGLTGTLQILRPPHIKVNDSESPEAIILAVNIPQGDAKVQYFKAKGEEEAPERGDPLDAAPTGVGRYWAEITLGTGDNSATAHVVYTIVKDDPQVVVPSAQATYGQKLGEVALENPEGNVEGDWEWVDDSLDVGPVGQNIFKANFMPDDEDSYNPVLNVDVTVTVGQAENPMKYVEEQTVKKDYSPSLQRATLKTATNAVGLVTYSIKSQKQVSSSLIEDILKGALDGIEDSVIESLAGSIASAIISGGSGGIAGIIKDVISGLADDTIGDIVNSILDGVNRSNVDYFSLNGTTLMIAEGTPAGDYKVVVEATAAGNNNYKSATKESTVTVTIKKAPNPAKVAPTASVMAGGHTVDLMENVTLNGAQGEVGFAFEGDNKGCTLDENGVLTSGYQAGPVIVLVTVGEEENYEALVAPITVTVGRMPNPLTYVEKQTVSVVYSDKAQTAELEKAQNGVGEVTYAIYSQMRGSDDVDFFDLALDEEKMNLTIKAGTPVGIYKVVVRAEAAGDDNYLPGFADSTVTVYVAKADNPLNYKGQTVDRIYSTSAQTGGLRPATKAVGAVRYEIVSQREKSIIFDIIIKAIKWAIETYLKGKEPKDPEKFAEDVGKEVLEALLGGGGIDQIKDILQKKFTGLSSEDILNIVNYLLGLLESAANVDYFALNGTTLTIAPCTPVGTYSVEVRATAQGDDDHKSGSKTASVTVNIDKAESVPAAVVAIHSTYDGSDKPLVSVTGVATGGTMLYASESGGFSESIPTGIEAGTYNVSYMVAGDDNHKDFGPASVQATIAKANASAVAPTALKLVYNGLAQALVEAGQADDGTMEYALGTSDGPTGKYSTAIPTGTNAGDYVVWYRVKGDDNHKDSVAEAVGVTIAKAPITVVTPPNAAAINYGQALKESRLTGGEWTPKVAGHFEWNVEDIVPVVADSGKTTYAVIFFPVDADNYRIARSQTTLEVAPLNPIVIPPEAIGGLVYNGKAQALVKPGVAIHGTMKYAVGKAAPTDAGGWSTKTPTGTEAGDYTVWYKVFGDENYRDTEPASLLVTIRAVPAGEVIPDSLVYNGKPQKLVKPGKVVGGTLQYLVSNSTPGDAVIWSETIPTGTEAGDYRVWYRVKGDVNHNDTEPAFVMSKISKAPIAPRLSITGWTYGDKPNDPVLTGNTGRGWETYLYSGEKNGQYTGTIPTTVGSWFVKAKVDETDN